jgi:branched-chain amino acid transport system substrate-binding protein
MKELPTDDRCSARARSAPTAARSTHAYLFEVKKPAESKGPYDYYKLRHDPGRPGLPPMDQGGCPLVKKK